MKIKLAGALTYPTYTAAKVAATVSFDPVKSLVSITATATAPVSEGKEGEVLISRPAVNYVETIGNTTSFALALDDQMVADLVIAGLAVEAAKAGVTVVGETHICRHDEDPSKWTPCVATLLGNAVVLEAPANGGP